MAGGAPAAPDLGTAAISHREAAQFRADRDPLAHVANNPARRAQIQENINLATRFRGLIKVGEPDPAGAKKAVEAARGRNKRKERRDASFDKKSQNEVVASFGGGRAKVKDTDGSLQKTGTEPDIDDTDLEPADKVAFKENLKQAESGVERVNNFLQYTDVYQRTQALIKEGKTPLDAERDALREANLTKAQYDKLRKDSLDHLRQHATIQSLFKEELADLPDDQQRDNIEFFFTSDPALRTKILENMRNLQRDATQLTEDEKDPQTTQAKETQKTAKAGETEKVNNALKIVDKLFAIDPAESAALKAEIQRRLAAGENIDDLTKFARDTFYSRNVVQMKRDGNGNIVTEEVKDTSGAVMKDAAGNPITREVPERDANGNVVYEPAYISVQDERMIRFHNATEARRAILNERLRELSLNKQNRRAQDVTADKTNVEAELRQLDADYNKNVLTQLYKDIDPKAPDLATQQQKALAEFMQKSQAYNDVEALLDPTKDQQGNYKSQFMAEMAGAITDVKTQKDAQQIIDDRKSIVTQERKANIGTRKEEETDMLEDLDNILSDSVLDLVNSRIDTMTELQKVYLAEQAAQAEKDGNKALADKIRDVEKRMNTNWILYDEKNGTKTPRTGQISADIRYLIYNGDPKKTGLDDDGDAVRRLVLRDMGIPAPQGIDVVANPEWWKTVSFDRFDDKTKDQIQKVYASVGDTYKEKLFTALISERTLKDKLPNWAGGGGPLAFKDHEWILLSEKYSDFIDRGVQKNKDAKARLAQLEQAGVLIDGKKKMLWGLFAILGLYAAWQAGGPLLTGGAALAGVAGGLNAEGISNAFNSRG